MFEGLRLIQFDTGRRRMVFHSIAVAGLLVAAAAVGWVLPRFDTSWSILLLAGLVGLGVAVLLIEKSEMGLILLLFGAFLIPLEISATESVAINVVILIVPLIAAIWVLKGMRHRQVNVARSRTMLPMLVFLAAAFISWLYGNATWDIGFPQPGNLYLIQTGQYAIFVLSFMAYFIAAQQSVRVLRWLTYGFLVFGILALIGRYGGPIGQPFSVLTSNAAGNGAFFVWFTALAAGQGLYNRKLKSKWRIILVVAAISVPVLGFFFNTSWTSSWLPPLVVLMFLIWLRSRFSASVLAVFLILFVLSGLVFQFYDWEFERELSVGGRLILWESVWNLAKEQPILGLGLTTYRQYHVFIPLLTEHGAWYQPNVNSHNLYIDLFAQMGIVGLAVFFWLVAEIGVQSWKLRRRFSSDFKAAYVASAIAGLLGTLVASGVVEWMFPFVYNVGLSGFRFTVFIWIFLGGLVILDNLPSGEDSS